MNSELCQELIHHLDRGDLAVGDAPKDVQSWFEELSLPTELLQFMQWHWPQNGADVKHLFLRSSQEIRSDTDTQRLLAHKFLNVGSGPNGDLLVIDFSAERCVPGFVSHDELWENEASNPRDCFQPIARSFESLLFRLAEERYIPTDYYAARAFNKFLAEEDGANV